MNSTAIARLFGVPPRILLPHAERTRIRLMRATYRRKSL